MNNRISNKVRGQIFERDDYTCQLCGVKLHPGMGGIHHKIPKSKGGSNDPSNLISLCANCNRSIGDKIVDFATTPVSSQLANAWVLLYKKAPRVTSTVSLFVSIIAIILTVYFSNEQRIKDEKDKKDNLNYYSQIEQLNKTEKSIEQLLQFVKEQQTNLKSTQDALESLKAEKEKLQPLVESDKRIIEVLFQEQEERNLSKVKKERWIGVTFGVVASILASTILMVLKYLFGKRKKTQPDV